MSHWLFKLATAVTLDFVTFVTLLMLHACIKVQHELVVYVSVVYVHGWCWKKKVGRTFLEAQTVNS